MDTKSKLTKKVTKEYARYASNADLIASGIVRPCGSGVWRDALAQLRDDVPGHYFGPIFPS